MKKLLVMLLAVVMLISVFACTNSGKPDDTDRLDTGKPSDSTGNIDNSRLIFQTRPSEVYLTVSLRESKR